MRPLLLLAALPSLLAGLAFACPLASQAALKPVLVADNAATSTPAGTSAGKPDAAAFPNSPNGSPMAGDKGRPVVTDKAACTGAGPTATCPGSPAPSSAADTSDTKIATPTTVNAPAKP